jgi:hypothetical protein
MAVLTLPGDFKEFLKLLASHGAEYLLVGGYAVSAHGYPRFTNDLDIWIGINSQNAVAVAKALTDFGFGGDSLTPDLFMTPNNVIRMGVPPLRLEILTSISGVDFDQCYAERKTFAIDEVQVPVISIERLKQNKAAAGRPKDLIDLDHLPK